MTVTVDLQVASEHAFIPSETKMHCWVNTVTVLHKKNNMEVSIRVIDEKESAMLNHTWRGKKGATNVLSFPAELPEDIPLALLGDLAICAPLIEQEAVAQHKTREAHWAHIVIHGTLHLLGYDHIKESDAIEMETLESHIMYKLGYPDPYNTDTLTQR